MSLDDFTHFSFSSPLKRKALIDQRFWKALKPNSGICFALKKEIPKVKVGLQTLSG